MAQIQFIATSPEQLQREISESVKQQLNEFLQHFKPVQPNEYLTRSEVAKMFSVDLSTIHNWCKANKLKPLSIGSRIYFLRSDIEQALTPLNN